MPVHVTRTPEPAGGFIVPEDAAEDVIRELSRDKPSAKWEVSPAWFGWVNISETR